MSRDWDDPEYKKLRAIVKKRDNHVCQMPGCKSKKALKVHHILTWARHRHLRYDEKNCITLCRCCHDSISKKEHLYAKLFLKIVRQKYGL